MFNKPNILITGTPGTGKSTIGKELSERNGLKYINIEDLANENNLFQGYDSKLNYPILDEDRILDEMEDDMAEGGVIVDYHKCNFFPQRWFNLVIVLRTDNAILYERFEKRGHTGKNLSENNDMKCKIFQKLLLEEAKKSNFYRYNEIVQELKNNTPDDMEENLTRIETWLEQSMS